MDERKSSELNEMLQSNGWLVFKERVEDKIKELESIRSIDVKQSAELQAVQITANLKAILIVEELIEEVKSLATARKITKKSML